MVAGHLYIILYFSVSLDISSLNNGFKLICHTIIAKLALYLEVNRDLKLVISPIFLPLTTVKLALLPNSDFSCSLRQVSKINTRLHCPSFLDDNKIDRITCPDSVMVEGKVYFKLQAETLSYKQLSWEFLD